MRWAALALTDGTGAIQTQYLFDPFGNTTSSGAASTSSFQYTGRENDRTGLYFYRARYYSPLLGRFVAEDPLGFLGGDTNLYRYVFSDPVDWGDPLGLLGQYRCSLFGGCQSVPFGNGINHNRNPQPTAGRKSRDRSRTAAQTCEDNGQFSFNIPFTTTPVTVAASTTFGPLNFSSTNDLNTVFPVIPWPEWFSFGASVDITINAPTNATANPSVGFGRNLGIGYFTTPNGPQGLSLNLGPSIGPPITVSVPTNNLCGIAAGDN